MAKDYLKISKKSFYIGLVVVVVALVLVGYFFYYAPKVERKEKVEEYKKALYDSIYCQYSCPLVEYTFENNQTQNLPKRECADECIANLKKDYVREQFTEEELLVDELALDVEILVSECRTNNINNQTGALDSESWVSCSLGKLDELKEKYNYLN